MAIGDYTRVYGRNGRYAHLLTLNGSVDIDSAMCGRILWTCVREGEWKPWLGTGSQAEYEKAASLPLCPRCEHLASGRAVRYEG